MRTIYAIYTLIKTVYALIRSGVPRLLLHKKNKLSYKLIHRIFYLLEKKNPDGQVDTRITDSLTKLGPSFVKLGQLLASRPDIVGTKISEKLAKLHNDAEPFSKNIAIKIIEEQLNQKAEDLFLEFEESKTAASVAQVHRAVLKIAPEKNKVVAIKILRPGITEKFNADLRNFEYVATLMEKILPASRRLKPVEVVKRLKRIMIFELDLRLEGAAMSEMSDNNRTDEKFITPKIFWKLTNKKILTATWIEGCKINNLKQLDKWQVDRKLLSQNLVSSFLKNALWYGFFHADMHPGNIIVNKHGVIGAVDFGITGRLEEKQRSFFAKILYGFIIQDYQTVAKVHFDAGFVPAIHDLHEFAQALRSIGEPINGAVAADFSMAQLLFQLLEITKVFEMDLQPHLLLLQKTMLVVEGVAFQLDPKFNMWKTAQPVIEEFLNSRLGKEQLIKKAKANLLAFKELNDDLPELIDNLRKNCHLKYMEKTEINNQHSHFWKTLISGILIGSFITIWLSIWLSIN